MNNLGVLKCIESIYIYATLQHHHIFFLLSLQFSCGSPLAHWLPICSISSKAVPARGCGGGRSGRAKTLQTCIIEQVRSQLFGKENKVLDPVKIEGNRCVLYWQGTTLFFFPPTILACVTISLQFFSSPLSSPFSSLRSHTNLLKTKRKKSLDGVCRRN